MDQPRLTLAAQYLRHVADLLRGMGADVQHWLELHELNEAELERAALTLDLPSLSRLLLDAEAIAREPALGLFVGERLVARTHGFVGYAALKSRTLRELLDVLQQFLGLRISVLALTYHVAGSDVRVVLNQVFPLGEIQRPVLEAVVMSVRNILEAVSMGACDIRSVSFPFSAPDYAPLARELIGSNVHYGQAWAGLTIPAAMLDVPLKMADPQAFREAEQICQGQLAKLHSNTTLSGRVRRLLLEKQNGFPSLPATARRLHMTPRTLHRRLGREQTSYRAILEDIRYRLAAEHLRSGHASVEEIAYMLGYSDPSNFRRAFRRWSGMSPSAYRSRGADERGAG